MKTLFEKIGILYENGECEENIYLVVEDKRIAFIGKERPTGKYDRVINGEGKLLCAGFYNCHTHIPMTLFRGYAEDLPLDRWLNEKIFPAEDRLTPKAVYAASMLAIAEMIACGTVSFSDMYYYCDEVAKAAIQTGIKANISRSTVAFDKNITAANDYRYLESVELYKNYHNSADGRIKIDMSLHAEYTTVPASCRYLSDFALENGLAIQLHLSETAKEHRECVERHGVTPTVYFEQSGVFRVPVTAAHCVHVTDEDIAILKKHGATAVHNPASNLKLGSGVMRLTAFADAGVRVALGTDGVASNNTLNIIKEAYLAAILQKGTTGDTAKMKSADFIKLLTENGALSQGRTDCGRIAVGCRADLVMLDIDSLPMIPVYNYCDSFLYSATPQNVVMTMVDGNILYENGEYKTLDIEKVKYDFKNVISTYFN